MKTWMIVPDLQIPLHDATFVGKLVEIAEYLKPQGLLFIGDLTNSTAISRWVKGKPGEYAGDLQEEFDQTRKIVADFGKAVGPDCEKLIQDSNHDKRARDYIIDNAPGLLSLRELEFSALAGLADNGVSVVRGAYEFAPGVVSMHGHERAYSSVPGRWGGLRVVEHGKHIVYGHTHTPHLMFTAQGTGDSRRNLWHMNVGHGMDMSRAEYLTDGFATWAQAFGTVTITDNGNAIPHLYPAINGELEIDGRIW